MEIPLSILKKLNERKAANAFRSLSIRAKGIDFYSNDYLGIANWYSPQTKSHGSTGSRLISGHDQFTEEVESQCATFFNKEEALLYNSGYDANLGVLSAVPQRGDIVLYDEYCHASIRDGIRLGMAKNHSFKHNSLEDLGYRLSRAEGIVYVVVESVYSMDGDKAPLEEIVALCQKYEAYLIVDEAHSGGVIGDNGEGLVSQLRLDSSIFIKIVTFGKAYGSHGAVVLSDKVIKDFLINFSRSLIYTTAMPPAAQERIKAVLEKVRNAGNERKKLEDLICFFQERAVINNLKVLESDSPIQGVVIPGNEQVKEKASQLAEKGFAIKPILSPTVPKGGERIRICLHSFNTRDEIKNLIEALK